MPSYGTPKKHYIIFSGHCLMFFSHFDNFFTNCRPQVFLGLAVQLVRIDRPAECDKMCIRDRNKTGQEHRRAKKAQSMVMNAFKICLRFAGTKVIVDGRENIPEDTAVLYVGNHSSYYDILCSYVATPSGAGFFAKKEMGKIPCLSHWMTFINCLFLDRKNIKEGMKTINKGTQYLKDGFSMVIFPEGTRSQEDVYKRQFLNSKNTLPFVPSKKLFAWSVSTTSTFVPAGAAIA